MKPDSSLAETKWYSAAWQVFFLIWVMGVNIAYYWQFRELNIAYYWQFRDLIVLFLTRIWR